jgi:hypothetical protein
MLGMIEGLLHEPGERLRTLFFNFRSNKSNEFRVTGSHVSNSWKRGNKSSFQAKSRNPVEMMERYRHGIDSSALRSG